ncbi:MAG TPA: metallophosphoesterase [Anaerolineae bacterium]|nr:metallophosphoesterase [Anaerolineae bacterium]
MMFGVEKGYRRLWTIERGRVMVVSDLHGNWDLYERYRARFVELLGEGEVDCLLFLGDLIHTREEEVVDESVAIVLDVLALQERYGERVIYLCGNHELPHIYGFPLSKGGWEYTPSFERALVASGRRAEVMGLFEGLPFYVRTSGGIVFMHAGAFPYGWGEETAVNRLWNWDHEAIRQRVRARLAGLDKEKLRQAVVKMYGAESYRQLVADYLAVSGEESARYDDFLVGAMVVNEAEFEHLWAALFTKCERQYGWRRYQALVAEMLAGMGRGYRRQKVIVAGHITIKGGYKVVGEGHFRLASGSHAEPLREGAYLVVDVGDGVAEAGDLVGSVGSVW